MQGYTTIKVEYEESGSSQEKCIIQEDAQII